MRGDDARAHRCAAVGQHRHRAAARRADLRRRDAAGRAGGGRRGRQRRHAGSASRPTSRTCPRPIRRSSPPTSSRRTLRIFAPKTSGSSTRERSLALDRAASRSRRPRSPLPRAERPSRGRAGRCRRHRRSSRAASSGPSVTGEDAGAGTSSVTLHRVGADSSGPIDSMRTDARGALPIRVSALGQRRRDLLRAAHLSRHRVLLAAAARGGRARRRRRDHRVRHDVVAGAASRCRAITTCRRQRVPTGVRDIVEVLRALERHRRHRGRPRLAERRVERAAAARAHELHAGER